MQLADVVGAVVGDIDRFTDYVDDQFKMRPIMGYPPLIGQVSQLAQGGQMYGGGGVAGTFTGYVNISSSDAVQSTELVPPGFPWILINHLLRTH